MEIEERRKIEYNLCGYLKTYIKKLCKDNGNINDLYLYNTWFRKQLYVDTVGFGAGL